MKIFVMLLILASGAAGAERLSDTIDSISLGENGEDHLILLQNGRVITLDENEALPKIGQRIEAELDKHNKVISILSLPTESFPQVHEVEEVKIEDNMTLLKNYEQVSTIFNRMNSSWKSKTECTDRANIWSYEEWLRSGHISKKVFVFFTSTYIRKYNFGWWFHVAPYTTIQNNGATTEYVLDRKYSSAPLLMKSWTDIFVRSKRSCPVSTYRHYRSNKYGAEHCFVVKSNMYNRVPYHVRMQEDYGQIQTRFNTSEINFSYRAFNQKIIK